jgi:hypothetical protein
MLTTAYKDKKAYNDTLCPGIYMARASSKNMYFILL